MKNFKKTSPISNVPKVLNVPKVPLNLGILPPLKLLIFLNLLFFSCTTPADPQPATLHLFIISECIADIRLFTPDGKEILQKRYDCQEAPFLDIALYESGPIIIHAQTPTGKTEKKVVTLKPNQITQATITF